jgi:hypothetical protein
MKRKREDMRANVLFAPREKHSWKNETPQNKIWQFIQAYVPPKSNVFLQQQHRPPRGNGNATVAEKMAAGMLAALS